MGGDLNGLGGQPYKVAQEGEDQSFNASIRYVVPVSYMWFLQGRCGLILAIINPKQTPIKKSQGLPYKGNILHMVVRCS